MINLIIITLEEYIIISRINLSSSPILTQKKYSHLKFKSFQI